MRNSPLSIAPSPRRTRSGCRLAPLPRSSRLRTRDAVLTFSPAPPAPPSQQQLQTGPCISGLGARAVVAVAEAGASERRSLKLYLVCFLVKEKKKNRHLRCSVRFRLITYRCAPTDGNGKENVRICAKRWQTGAKSLRKV